MSEKPSTNEFFLKAIDITQDIIKRMANNSFLIKGWTITLIVVTMLFKGENIPWFLALIPLIAFWILDGYFLRQERMFRKLYDYILENKSNHDVNLLEMDTDKVDKDSIVEVIFSGTLIGFYVTILALILSFAALTYSAEIVEWWTNFKNM